MQPRKLNVHIALFAYGGNGGVSMIHPDIAEWLVPTVIEMKADERIGNITHRVYSDTPITLTRNRSVLDAREVGADLILMIDSDQNPDHDFLQGMPYTKPFWSSSFDFIYERYDKGPHVVGAPYCGPSPCNNVYVFRWSSWRNSMADQDVRIEQFTRGEAATKIGIEEVAALPTGLILFDTRVFELTEPRSMDDSPWFYYEWKNRYADEKLSTEDVTATRDLALAGMAQLGYSPIHVNWDAWAGHTKPEIIGKPNPITTQQINSKYQYAMTERISDKERRICIGGKAPLPSEDQLQKMNECQSDEMLARLGATLPSDLEVLKSIVGSFNHKPVVVVELGTFIGDSAKAMADAGAIVHTIDNWRGSPMDGSCKAYRVYGEEAVRKAFERNVGDRLHRSIHTYRGDSTLAAESWHGDKVDMVFVDAGHEYHEAFRDIKAWLPHVRVGGVFSGHDYCDAFPGVKQAVDELFDGHQVNVHGNVWWVVVTEDMHATTGELVSANGYNEDGRMWQEN